MPKTNKPARFGGNIIDAMDGPFADWFAGQSWARWRAILKAAYALPMTDAEIDLFREVAEREPPSKRVRELWVVGGRRGAKSAISSLVVAFASTQFDGRRRQIGGITLPALRRGERATALCFGVDRDTARIVLRYVQSYFSDIPELKPMVTRETRDGFELANGVDILIGTTDFRSVRGRAVLCCVMDEVAFFKDENSASPDTELYNAVTPGMLTLKDQAMLVAISTPHKKSGLLWNKFSESFGKDDSNVLVVKATTLQLNPTVDAETIAAEIAANPELKKAEYLCEWRTDISSFIGSEIYDAAVVRGRTVISPPEAAQCVGFVDVSGGVSDSHTCAVAFPDGTAAVLAAVRELKTSDTDAVVAEFATLLRSYGVSQARADRYGAQWVVDAFKRQGIELIKSPYTRSEIYGNFSPMLNSGQVRLLDNKRLRSQVLALERRTIRGTGRDQIDHPRAGEDDLANSAAGACVMAARPQKELGYGKSYTSVENGPNDPGGDDGRMSEYELDRIAVAVCGVTHDGKTAADLGMLPLTRRDEADFYLP
jgi:hypothetical protein